MLRNRPTVSGLPNATAGSDHRGVDHLDATRIGGRGRRRQRDDDLAESGESAGGQLGGDRRGGRVEDRRPVQSALSVDSQHANAGNARIQDAARGRRGRVQDQRATSPPGAAPWVQFKPPSVERKSPKLDAR